MCDREHEINTRIAELIRKVEKHEIIGLQIIELLDDNEIIELIHSMAEVELRRGLMSYSRTIACNQEIIIISLTIIGMCRYEEGNFYEGVSSTYRNLYGRYSKVKIEKFIREILSSYRGNISSNERIINVVLENAIVPQYYLADFFDFVFDIYKINFQWDIPEKFAEIEEEFTFVFEGLQQNMLSSDDNIEVSATKKTYRLIKSTKNLISDRIRVDYVIKLSAIIIKLIDASYWSKSVSFDNQYIKSGFENWKIKYPEPMWKSPREKNSCALRSRWEPRLILENNHVYLVPPMHRISAELDYTTVKVVLLSDDDLIYSEERPDIREIIGGYEIRPNTILINNPFASMTYRVYAGDRVIYDSGDKLHRKVIAFSHADGIEIKNNTDYNGTAIFCYKGEKNHRIYYKGNNYSLARYAVHLGDRVEFNNEIFYFKALEKAEIFGIKHEKCFLYDMEKDRKYEVFKEARVFNFLVKNLEATLEINIDGKRYKAEELELQEEQCGGNYRCSIRLPILASKLHRIVAYELLQGRKVEIAHIIFAVDKEFCFKVANQGDTYQVSVASGLLRDGITKTITPGNFAPNWLKVSVGGKLFSYQVPLPISFYSFDGETWKSLREDMWKDDISANTSLKLSNLDIDAIRIWGSEDNLIEYLNVVAGTLYKEVKIGFLRSHMESASYFKIDLIRNGSYCGEIVCYNRCILSEKSAIEYDDDSKSLLLRTEWIGKGRVYFTVEDETGKEYQRSNCLENGETVAIEGLKTFVPYIIKYYEKEKGLTLVGDREIARKKNIFYDWSALIGKSFKVIEANFHKKQFKVLGYGYMPVHVRGMELYITKQVDEDLFEGELYKETPKGRLRLAEINPVEVVVAGSALNSRGEVRNYAAEVIVTKDGQKLLFDIKGQAIIDSLNAREGIRMHSCIIDLKGQNPCIKN